MARSVLVLAALLVLPSVAWAHKPLLSVEDNEDGTLCIEAGFSDGGSGAGHKIILKEKATGKVISQHKVGEDGSLGLKKPGVPYTVTFDAGPGHVVTKDGPPPDAGAQSKKPAEAPARAEAGKEPAEARARVKPAAAAPHPAAQPVAAVSPGSEMAFKMMLTMQVVTAVGLFFVFGVVVFWIGYLMGKRASGESRRKEVPRA